MSLQQNFLKKLFWINVLKIGIPFLIIVTLFALFFNSAGNIFSGDFKAVYEVHFADKRWIRFWLPKVVISIIYGIYITNKKMK
ncbi:hypothetical protein [Tenacibaculum amylolyticum]|uniref:hypothetical protein n=1 Tax=Tenacibaculum amylolyticum TaxID=104269 RepID=UPI0038941025